jgi:phenylalanyl-tRNA synthetase beta chain
MTISYNWLSEYLPYQVAPEELSKILTSIGLEVESLEAYESLKGGLKGLVTGEVLTCDPHPNADKLRLTSVNTGEAAPLQIVCGAPNVATGQKVIVAPVGTTIYPSGGDPLTMKVAKIRGVESYGMICAADEIGLGTDHSGILVLPDDVAPGTPAAAYFNAYNDFVYEIGLTPNRMDAMSHWGVARDVCAYLAHHRQEPVKPVLPPSAALTPKSPQLPIAVEVRSNEACKRYAGVAIAGISVQESPEWLKNKLLAIGQRPINNIVDITNFILHATGQPLHAFDYDAIKGQRVIVQTLPAGTPFTTLDEKERKLTADDLVICNGEEEPMCLAGVFGGAHSGVQTTTTNIFLESAWFHPVSVRRSMLHHGLRTDAAARFEKGVDISQVANILTYAAQLITGVAGGYIASDVLDHYALPEERKQVTLKFSYLLKLSGKSYTPEAAKNMLQNLGFEVIAETAETLTVAVPYSKPDIALPADLVEEIIRIDGLDNIAIPSTITIAPATDSAYTKEKLKEKILQFLAANGFSEIVTNSITNSRYYDEATLQTSVKMINSLSAELDILRPSMLHTGLESVAYNINRRNSNLRFAEFGKTYHSHGTGNYTETEHIALFVTGNDHEAGWRSPSRKQDLFVVKGLLQAVAAFCGIDNLTFREADGVLQCCVKKDCIATISNVTARALQLFDIRQAVLFADIDFGVLLKVAGRQKTVYKELSRFPAVQRDLALVVDKSVKYTDVEQAAEKLRLQQLSQIRLFDLFESEKLGNNKQSMAVNFTFTATDKTLTDKEIDSMMNKIISTMEQQLSAEIRK